MAASAAAASAQHGGVRCAICKRTDANYLVSTARMWHSKRCAHSVCQGCHNTGFASRSTAIKCPHPCGVTLTRADFSDKTPEEREYERERDVRRSLKSVFNLRREDFAGRPEAWHAYCERQEALVLALVTGSEAERKDAERAVEEHRRAHAVEINRAAARRTAEETAAQREERADLNARKAAASAVADAAAAAAAAAEEVRRFKFNLTLGEVDGGGGGSVAGLQGVAARLAAIKAARAAAAAAKRAERPPPPPVPCPGVPLPRLGEGGPRNAAWAGAPWWRLPGDSLPAHWRAAGWVAGSEHAWEAQEVLAMLEE